jgi:hypothetical protein
MLLRLITLLSLLYIAYFQFEINSFRDIEILILEYLNYLKLAIEDIKNYLLKLLQE